MLQLLITFSVSGPLSLNKNLDYDDIRYLNYLRNCTSEINTNLVKQC